jgi:spermidine synthase
MPSFSFLAQPTDIQIDNILSLYRLAGWWQPSGDDARDRDQVRGIVRGSHCFLIATADAEPDSIIGMGRSISDGASDAYIQDVVVTPAHRSAGVAREIIRRIVARLREDGLEWIGLVAERNTQGFYEPLGFSPMADSMPMIYRIK